MAHLCSLHDSYFPKQIQFVGAGYNAIIPCNWLGAGTAWGKDDDVSMDWEVVYLFYFEVSRLFLLDTLCFYKPTA